MIPTATNARAESRKFQQELMDKEYPELMEKVEQAINKAIKIGLLWTHIDVIDYLNETQEKVRDTLEAEPFGYFVSIKANATLGISWSNV